MLTEVQRDFISSIAERARRYFRVQRVLDFALVILGGGVSAAQFIDMTGSKGVDPIKLAAIIGAVFIAIIAVIRIYADPDPAKDLERVRKILELANEVEAEQNLLKANYSKVAQSASLSQSYFAMRGAIEQMASNRSDSVEECIQRMITVAMKQLEAAAGFHPEMHYCFCVYKAVRNGQNKELLKPIADLRSVPCPRDDARQWPIGVSPSGIAFASSTDVIVQDLSDGVGSKMSATVPTELRRESDAKNHRALAAIPIIVGNNGSPWGVVVGSADKVGHFVDQRWVPSSIPTDTVRALAEMCALLIATRQS